MTYYAVDKKAGMGVLKGICQEPISAVCFAQSKPQRTSHWATRTAI
jgi:hypothetical protein